MSKNLVLTGMMGVGKSTIGKSLADRLSFSFVDIDKLIETKEGSSINLIFRNKSENYFRRLENIVSLEELKKSDSVKSLGGGAFLNNAIRRAVKYSSVSFWLDVDINELTKRLNKTKRRPLLAGKNLKDFPAKITQHFTTIVINPLRKERSLSAKDIKKIKQKLSSRYRNFLQIKM